VEVWGGHWSSEVEALAGVGAEFGQVVVLCGCLDALGDDGQGSLESSCEAGYPLRYPGLALALVMRRFLW
jgi:hypothetical protein